MQNGTLDDKVSVLHNLHHFIDYYAADVLFAAVTIAMSLSTFPSTPPNLNINELLEKETAKYRVIGKEGFAPKNEEEYIATLSSWESSAKLLLDSKGKYDDLFYIDMLDSAISEGTIILEEGVKRNYKYAVYSHFHLSIAYFENLFKARVEIRKRAKIREDDDKFKQIVGRFMAAGYGAVDVFVDYANELASNSKR